MQFTFVKQEEAKKLEKEISASRQETYEEELNEEASYKEI